MFPPSSSPFLSFLVAVNQSKEVTLAMRLSNAWNNSLRFSLPHSPALLYSDVEVRSIGLINSTNLLLRRRGTYDPVASRFSKLGNFQLLTYPSHPTSDSIMFPSPCHTMTHTYNCILWQAGVNRAGCLATVRKRIGDLIVVPVPLRCKDNLLVNAY